MSAAASFRAAISRHLASRDMSRVIYGAIIGLALVLALQQHPPSATQAFGALVATAIAVGLADVYSEYVGAEARHQRAVTREELSGLFADAGWVAFGAGFPAVFLFLAAVGLIDDDTAFNLAKWTGLGLILTYGYVAGRLAGNPVARALLHSAWLGVIAGALIALKALLH